MTRGEQLRALRGLQLPALKAGTVVVSGGVAKSVLRCIDDHGAKCWASLETIANETCWPLRTVRRAIRALEKARYVKIEYRSGRSSNYSIDWRTLDSMTAHPGHSDRGTQPDTPDIVTPAPDMVTGDPGHSDPNPGHGDPRSDRSEKESRKKRESARAPKFVPPDLHEVKSCWTEEHLKGNPEAFFNHFEANGWTQGRQSKPLRNWKAAARNWSLNEEKFSRPSGNGKPRTANVGPGVNYDPNRSMVDANF